MKKLKGRDVITIGIFTAIYFVINFAFMLLGGIHPLIWILMPGFIAFFALIPYMIMAGKVQKPWAIVIMGAITAAIYYLTGQFSLIIILSFVVACLLAEIIRYVGDYKGYKNNALSYAVFSMGMIGSPIQVWILKEQFITKMLKSGMPVDYVDTLKSFINIKMLIVLIAAPFVLALLSSLIFKPFLKKHFGVEN